jgi:hypothetical protein
MIEAIQHQGHTVKPAALAPNVSPIVGALRLARLPWEFENLYFSLLFSTFLYPILLLRRTRLNPYHSFLRSRPTNHHSPHEK